MTLRKSPQELRSFRWLGRDDLRAFGHRSRLQQLGYDRADWAGKPVIGIVNTWSDINACHGHLRARAEDVKRGVYQAGGFPVELPAMSLAEIFVKPSTMLYRNFLAMECEELLRSHPIDGAVLMGGCDKTTPGLIMGAISMGLPAVYVPAGPMLRGNWRGQVGDTLMGAVTLRCSARSAEPRRATARAPRPHPSRAATRPSQDDGEQSGSKSK
jgi:dihydroxy-acid dehydratase